MSRTSSVIEIVATASKLLTDISDTPVLSPLKPLGVTLLAICEHAAALKGNQEAALMLAERLNRVVRALANRPQDFEGDMAGNYIEDIKTLENVLVKIATTLQDQRQKWWSRFSPKTRASELSNLFSELDYAISIFGLSADFEARQAFQAVRTLASKEVNSLESSELYCPTISLSRLRTYRELNTTNNYSVQVGTYQNQAVVVKKYYAKRDKIFEKDLRQRLNQTHPGIACVIGSAAKVAIMMLCAEGIMFCQDDLFDLESVRRPWQQREIVLTKEAVDSRRPPTSVVPRNPGQNRGEVVLKQLIGPFHFIKKSDALLRQFNSIIQFLRKMDVKVAWWEFKPSWAGLRGGKQIVLIDWAEDTILKQENDFEPQYAIHIIGLGFSDLVPNVFRDSGRLLTAGASTGPEEKSHPSEQRELEEDREPTYCYCDRVSYGEMIPCDGDHCARKWFHLGCIGLTSGKIPASWICDDCSPNVA